MVLFVVLARTTAFLWAVLAGELVLLCFHRGRQLRQVLGAALAAALFCAVIVAPSFFLGNGRYALLLPCKTFLTVTALMLLQENLAWHELTGALRTFRIPSLVIFILDTTLRYIAILGQEASELLTALKLRSVGHNPDKQAAMSGVAGIMLQSPSACPRTCMKPCAAAVSPANTLPMTTARNAVSRRLRPCSSWFCWPMPISSSAWKECSHDSTRRRLFRL